MDIFPTYFARDLRLRKIEEDQPRVQLECGPQAPVPQSPCFNAVFPLHGGLSIESKCADQGINSAHPTA